MNMVGPGVLCIRMQRFIQLLVVSLASLGIGWLEFVVWRRSSVIPTTKC